MHGTTTRVPSPLPPGGGGSGRNTHKRSAPSESLTVARAVVTGFATRSRPCRQVAPRGTSTASGRRARLMHHAGVHQPGGASHPAIRGGVHPRGRGLVHFLGTGTTSLQIPETIDP